MAKSNLQIAVDETRDTEGSPAQEDRKHTSGGVFIVAHGALSSVVNKEKGAVRTMPDKEGRIVEA